MTGIKWTRRTTEKIAHELRAGGIDVCPNTVGCLLRQLGFRLRVNHKKLTRRADPGRDAQFAYITAQREHFAAQGWPIISVDAKHRELVGNFANHGATWSRQPIEVNAYDFRSQAEGVAIPYGIYDIGANRGSMFVGTSHNTPTFAVDSIAKWWVYDGRRRYPDATQLLVLADGGGSNGAKARAWKHALQHRLVRPPWPHRHRLPLSHRRVEMEPRGAPAVQRDQQELGRATPRQLPDHPQLPSHHHDHHRTHKSRPTSSPPTTPPASRPPTRTWPSYKSDPTTPSPPATTPSAPAPDARAKTRSYCCAALSTCITTRSL